jgi:hypothetical protein
MRVSGASSLDGPCHRSQDRSTASKAAAGPRGGRSTAARTGARSKGRSGQRGPALSSTACSPPPAGFTRSGTTHGARREAARADVELDRGALARELWALFRAPSPSKDAVILLTAAFIGLCHGEHRAPLAATPTSPHPTTRLRFIRRQPPNVTQERTGPLLTRCRWARIRSMNRAALVGHDERTSRLVRFSSTSCAKANHGTDVVTHQANRLRWRRARWPPHVQARSPVANTEGSADAASDGW